MGVLWIGNVVVTSTRSSTLQHIDPSAHVLAWQAAASAAHRQPVRSFPNCGVRLRRAVIGPLPRRRSRAAELTAPRSICTGAAQRQIPPVDRGSREHRRTHRSSGGPCGAGQPGSERARRVLRGSDGRSPRNPRSRRQSLGARGTSAAPTDVQRADQQPVRRRAPLPALRKPAESTGPRESVTAREGAVTSGQ
jgi:hypothetical protein